MKTIMKRTIALLTLVSLLFLIGCFKKGGDIDSSGYQEDPIKQEIEGHYKAMIEDEDFQTAINHPDMAQAKTIENSMQVSSWDIIQGFKNLYSINEKLNKGEFAAESDFSAEIQKTFDFLEANITANLNNLEEYIRIMKASGMADAIEKHYSQLTDKLDSQHHPVYQGVKDYFVSGFGFTEEEVKDFYLNESHQQDIKRGYLFGLEESLQSLQYFQQEMSDLKTEIRANISNYFAQKNITVLEPLPEDDSQTRGIFGSIWKGIKKFVKKYILSPIFKWILRQIEALTFVHYNEYFSPGAYIETSHGYTPGHGFYVGGGHVYSHPNESGTPQEYPYLEQRTILGQIYYADSNWYLIRDGQTFLIQDTSRISRWQKLAVQAHDNAKASIEATVILQINQPDIDPQNGTGYLLSVVQIHRIYEDPLGPSIIAYNPIGNDMPYTSDINIRFSEAMDAATINASTIFIDCEGQTVTGTFHYDPVQYLVTFKPESYLEKNKSFTVSVTGGVKGANGRTIKATQTWNFTTNGVSNLFDEANFDEAVFGY